MCWICRGVGIKGDSLHGRISDLIAGKDAESVEADVFKSEVNYNSTDAYTRENLLEKPILIDNEYSTNATFDFHLLNVFTRMLDGKTELTVYIDRKGLLGESKVTKKEKKHIEKQLAIVESKIDESTGNAFDIQTTTNPGYYDLSILHADNIKKLTGIEAAGLWHTSENAVIYGRAAPYKKKLKSDIYKKWQIKQILAHEIGHVFGLNHPIGDLYKKYANTVMGGADGEKISGTLLSQGDLNLLGQGWQNTFNFTQPDMSEVNAQSPIDFTLDSLRENPLFKSGEGTSTATFNFNNAEYMSWFNISKDRILTYYIDEAGLLGKNIEQNNSQHIQKQLEIVEATLDSATNNAFDIIRVGDSASADIDFINSTDTEDLWNNTLSNWDITDGIVDFKDNMSWPSDSIFELDDSTINQALSKEIGHIFGLDRPMNLSPGVSMNTIMGGSGLTNEFLTSSDLQVLSSNWVNTIDFMGFG